MVTVVTMDNMFIFRKQQSSKSVESMLLTHVYPCEIHSKLVLSSHKDRIRAGVLIPHFHRLHHTCYGNTLFLCRFFNSKASSQLTVHSYARCNSHDRSEKRRSSLNWVMQVQSVWEYRRVDMAATLARFTHVNILGS